MSPSAPIKLTDGPIAPHLLRLSAPMLIGILAMMGFYLIDTWFVGRLGIDPLAAITLTFPVISVFGCLVIGLGVGAMAIVSQEIGAGEGERTRRSTTDALSLALIAGSLLSIVGYLTIDPLFRLLGATDELLPLVRAYMTLWYASTVFYIVPMIGNNIIRSTGDTLTPSLIMLGSMLVNAVLDPIFIFGFGPIPAMGIAGASLAGFIVRLIMCGSTLYILGVRAKLLTHPWPGAQALLASWRAILVVGLPVSISNAIIPIAMGGVTRIIARFGHEAVAGFGAASRIETFGLTLIMALSTGISPFVGQNFGAGRFDRIGMGLGYARTFSLAWGAVLCVVFFFFGGLFAEWFKDDAAVIASAQLYLLIIPFSLGLRSIHQVTWTALNVMHRPWDSLALEILLAIVLWLPLAYVGARYFGLAGVFGGLALGNVVGGIAAWVWCDAVLKKKIESQ